MPIEYIVTGDLLDMFEDGAFDAIAHGCNCMNTMGSGVAKQIAMQYTRAKDADNNTIRGDWNKLGNHSRAQLPSGQRIYNLYTQYKYGRGKHVEYLAVAKCFDRLDACAYETRVGIPKIGAGLGGGDWGIISKIIDENTPNLYIGLVVQE